MITREEKNEKVSSDIEEEEKKNKIKRTLKITSIIFGSILSLLIISFIGLRYVGNYGIKVREYAFYKESLPSLFSGIKIVHFGDIHYNEHLTNSKIEDLVAKINETKPDIVIFTGDLIDQNYDISDENKSKIKTLLKSIDSTLGKWAILGDEDLETSKIILEESDFKILNKESSTIYIDNEKIQLVGIGNEYANIEQLDNELFTLTIVHKPDYTTEILNNINTPIILAGHSHNGQIRIPFIGGLLNKEGAKKYSDSYYNLEETELLITGGIGNSYYHFRLFNHPSINLIRLRKN